MKITFIVSRPLRYPAQLQDFKQSAKGWIATLIQSLGDQLNNGGDGTIGMDIDGVRFEFRVVRIPGVMDTIRVEVESPNAPHRQAERRERK